MTGFVVSDILAAIATGVSTDASPVQTLFAPPHGSGVLRKALFVPDAVPSTAVTSSANFVYLRGGCLLNVVFTDSDSSSIGTRARHVWSGSQCYVFMLLPLLYAAP